MSALPEQTLASWEDTLKKVGTLQPEHISAYSLILEKGTPFYQLYETGKQAFLLPDEDTERRMYEMTEDYLKRIGLYRYEIWVWAWVHPPFGVRYAGKIRRIWKSICNGGLRQKQTAPGKRQKVASGRK